MQPDFAIASPACHRQAREFGPVVHNDGLRKAADCADCIECTRDPSSRKRRINLDGETFTRVVVHDIQRSYSPTRLKTIVNKVERPSFVYRRDNRRRRSPPECDTALQALANLQMCLTINAQHPLDVYDPSIATNQYGEAPEAEPSPLRSEFFKACTKWAVVLWNANIPNHPSIRADISTRLAFANVELIPDRLHASTLLHRR